MTEVFSKEEIEKIADHYGITHQMVKATEEMAELTVEISKYLNGDGNCSHLIEELADTQIMVWQLVHLLNCKAEMTENIKRKVARQNWRMNEDRSY